MGFGYIDEMVDRVESWESVVLGMILGCWFLGVEGGVFIYFKDIFEDIRVNFYFCKIF